MILELWGYGGSVGGELVGCEDYHDCRIVVIGLPWSCCDCVFSFGVYSIGCVQW